MQAIIITGGTGMVGQSLTNYLVKQGFIIHILTRNTARYKNTDSIKYFAWDTQKQTYDTNVLSNAVAIVNLAGESIAAKRWTKLRKLAIKESRIAAGLLLTKLLSQEKHNIDTLIQASAIGWYAPNATNENGFQEDLAPHNDYLGTTCETWEQSISAVPNTIRKVILRIGIVLNKDGGMVKELAKPMQLGILPIFGNGKQIVPWVHQADLNGIIHYCILQKMVLGIYNAVASKLDSQKEVSKSLAKVLAKKIAFNFPIPSFLLKLILGEMSVELIKSSKIENAKIKEAGYTFIYPALGTINNL